MDGKKIVSVVVASYNMGKYLPMAVQTVLAQTYPHLEVNVVDDGSTDNTREVMRQFDGDPRVRYHCQENGGQAKAKNKGILEAKGNFIAFLDADDLWTPDKLEKQLPLFDASEKIGVVYTNFLCVDEKGSPLPTPKRSHYTGRISSRLLVDNFVTGMSSMVRKECFDKVGLFDESLPMGIDYDLWLRISTKYEFEYLDDVTYLYRQWPGQMSHNQSKRHDCAVKIMTRFLEENPGLIDQQTINEAWAHTYVGRGNGLKVFEKKRWQALKYYLYAVKAYPGYLPAWKAIIKLVIL